jgi:hypothetical protein
MSDRVKAIRQQMREEAIAREERLASAMQITQTIRVPRGRGAAAYAETACPRCGVRSGVGCAHREAGDTTARLSSFERRRSLT